ncbi:hypothetical protein FPOAC2_04407 [Fusarium poae]|uniref:hypothetical protein n=1 Tax=Fusarium poae TaxID=36050 RepID=UPI001CE8E192|nr:hypothetical protein FPOAC1_004324 [Fusarium poae]KAG8671087.1 hypothetical protein FPOAC1_004324 [Fusarium poae]
MLRPIKLVILAGLGYLVSQTRAGPCKPQTTSTETSQITTTSDLPQISITTTLIETSATSAVTAFEETTQSDDVLVTTTSDSTSASTTIVPEPESTSLLDNGGFDILPATIEPWEKYLAFGDQAEISISDTISQDGRGSARFKYLTGPRPNVDPQYMVQKLDKNKVSFGVTYQLTAWFRSDVSASPLTLACPNAFMQGIYDTNKYVARKGFQLNEETPNQWQSFSLQFSFSEQQFNQGDLYVWVSLFCRNGFEGFMDSVALEVVPVDDTPSTTDLVPTTTSTPPDGI